MPRKPVPASDTLSSLDFPVAGVNVSTEYELQPPRTTPAGVNVRAYEPGQDRVRGGSRGGLAKAVWDPVNGASAVQLIDAVVLTDPVGSGGGPLGPAGSGADDGAGGYTGSGGYGAVKSYSRPGGNSHWYDANVAGNAIEFVQQKTASLFGDAAPWTISFTLNVTAGHLLLCAVFVFDPDTAGSTPTDSLGNLWTLAASTDLSDPLHPTGTRLFYAITNGSGPCTVTVAPNAHAIAVEVCILEYKNVDVLLPLDGTKVNAAAGTTAVSSGSVPVGAANEMVLAAVNYQGVAAAFTPAAGFTVRSDPFATCGITVMDKIGVSADTALTGTLNAADNFYSAGASWRKR